MKYNGDDMWIQGYREFSYFQNAIEKLTGGEIKLESKEYTSKNLIDYVTEDGKVAEKEIQVACNLNKMELQNAIDVLLSSGIFEKLIRGNGFFIKQKEMGFCDSETGVCHF